MNRDEYYIKLRYAESQKKNASLYHHGILGQKWGVRRFQNPDGTLTAEGRKRLAIEGKYNDMSTSEKMRQANMVASKIENPYTGELKESSDPNVVMTQIKATVKPVDQIDGKYSKYFKDKTFYDKWSKDAEFGLKALSNMRKDIGDPTDEGEKEWFLFEDQTIGLPMIASMVNRGVDKNNLITLIKNVESSNVKYDDYNEVGEFIFSVNNGNYKQRLEQFAEECYKQKNKK